MPDTFTSTTRTSYGSRIGSSFKGIAGGFVIFLIGFPVLVWNEGRSVKRARALNEGEKNVVAVAADAVDPANEGSLVHFAGRAVTEAVLSDPLFGVTITGDLQLVRSAEMYQWVEEKVTQTKTNTGGSQTTTTTYKYKKEWSDSLEDSDSFEHPEGHANPGDFTFPPESWCAEDVQVGAFAIPASRVAAIGSASDMYFPLTATSVPDGVSTNSIRIPGGWYIPAVANGGTPQSPQIGDERVKFGRVPQSDVSFVAKQIGSTIAAYQTKNGPVLLQRNGILSAEEMFAAARKDNAILTWILRLVGFILFFAGIGAILKPIRVLADVLPFLGRIVGMGLGFVAFVVALVFWLVTVAIAWIAYRPLVGIPLLIAAAALIFMLVKRSRNASVASTRLG